MRKPSTKEISVSEARSHWYELLRQVGSGKTFVITHRGKPVAELVAPKRKTHRMTAD